MKKSLATKTVSLNEAESPPGKRSQPRRAKKPGKQERAARKESQPTTYEITLKNADTPGLPAPATTISPPTAKVSESPADETEEAEASVPPSDPVLRESERILADYVAMLHQPSAVAVAAH